MRVVLKFLQSRMALLVGILILQIILTAFIIIKLSKLSSVIPIAFTLFSVVVLVWLLANHEQREAYKLIWAIVILLIPLFGGVFYVVFGMRDASRKEMRKRYHPYQEFNNLRKQDKDVSQSLLSKNPDAALQAKYIKNVARNPVFYQNESQYFPCGEDFFEQLLKDLNAAKRYIFLEFFIIERGVMLDSIIEILERKAQEGVVIKFLYDDVGSALKIASSFPEELKAKGIGCHAYNGRGGRTSFILNNRNHRKIVVIDGLIAYTGGCNLADEYINVKEKFGYWKDTMVRIKGSAAYSFALDFLELWDFATETREQDPEFYKAEPLELVNVSGKGYVTPYVDLSPIHLEPVGRNVYLNAIQDAKKYIYIMTPYLILDEETRSTLLIAASMGVEIIIMTPGIPDKKLVFQVTRANYEPLIDAGIKVFEFSPGFLHAKSLVVDGEIAVVGTCNFDYRSFFLHFECGAWLYETQAVQEAEDDFVSTLSQCREITPEDIQNVGKLKKMGRSVLSAFAPLF